MNLRVPSKQLQEKAKEELNEVPDRTENDIAMVKEWIHKQPHLNARTEDQWILGFLRGCKFSIQQTKAKIDMYYTVRTMIPEFFANRDPFLPEIQKVLKQGPLLPLPIPQGSAESQLLLYRWPKVDAESITCTEMTKVYFMLMDILLYENDNCVISGAELVLDSEIFPLSYLLQLTPMYLKQFVLCALKAYPIRLKGIHNINAPSVLDTATAIFKGFISDKLRDRVFVYGRNNTKEFYSRIPRSHLPKEYGGNGGGIDELIAFWKKKVESYRDWFLEEDKYKTEENLRPGKPQTSLELFGIDGSFRKLAID